MKDSQRFIAIINTAIRYCKWLIVILVALICCSGIRVVNNHEVAVVLRFGRLVGDTREEQVKEPGLLLAFPYVIDEVIKVPVGKVHEVSITTHAASADPTYAEIEDTGYVITGDENIIHIDATLKYQISDPVEYALYNSDPETEINGVVSGRDDLLRGVQERGRPAHRPEGGVRKRGHPPGPGHPGRDGDGGEHREPGVQEHQAPQRPAIPLRPSKRRLGGEGDPHPAGQPVPGAGDPGGQRRRR